MPRVNFVKKARKDNPVAKKGESYYWWQFAYCSKSFSRTRPRASQLTRSEFLSEIYSIVEEIEDASEDDFEEESDLESFIEDLVSRVEERREAAEDSFNNMPEGLQEGDTGQLLEARTQYCEQMVDEMESAKDHEGISEMLSDLKTVSYDGE